MAAVPLIVDIERGVNDMPGRDGSCRPIERPRSAPVDAQIVQAVAKAKSPLPYGPKSQKEIGGEEIFAFSE